MKVSHLSIDNSNDKSSTAEMATAIASIHRPVDIQSGVPRPSAPVMFAEVL